MRTIALVVLFASAALAANGISIDTATRFEFTDAASGGSAAQTVTAGTYVMRVTDSDAFVCYAGTCASGGEKWPQGTVILISFGASTSVSCRSAASTGDIIFTKGS